MTFRTQKMLSVAEDLAREGLLAPEKLEEAKLAKNIGNFLIEQGLLTDQGLTERLAKKAGISAMSLSSYQPDSQILKLMQLSQVRRWNMIPVGEFKGKLRLATADPFDFATLDEARSELGRDIDWVMASEAEIKAITEKFYADPVAKPHAYSSAVEVIDHAGEPVSEAQTPLIAEAQAVQIVSSVDELLQYSLRERASDIHLEPTRQGLKIRLRIDGVLEEYKVLPATMQQGVLSRFKIIGGMDVAEHRIPQDGRTSLRINGKELDIRIATYPTLFGEAAAIRLLSKDNLITLESLGFCGADGEAFEKLIHKPHGIFLVTGPTGSGKTTTLYAALQKIDRKKKHVLSVEDPVENEIEGVDQTQINTKAGVTFAGTLRAMLREDPDVIMVGEIRDQETADISLRAAMTGHLVLSTLHTNTAIGSIARLIDLGVETYLVSSTLLGVVAQRLVRRVCQNCKEEVSVSAEDLKALGPKAEGLHAFVGKGCQQCGNRGFKGRVGLYEMIRVDDEFRVLINNRAPDVRLREKASASGFRSILEDGIEKIKQGMTTVEEVLKVTGEG